MDREIEERSMLGKFSAISLMLWFLVAPFLIQIEAGSNVSSSKVSENSISNKFLNDTNAMTLFLAKRIQFSVFVEHRLFLDYTSRELIAANFFTKR